MRERIRILEETVDRLNDSIRRKNRQIDDADKMIAQLRETVSRHTCRATRIEGYASEPEVDAVVERYGEFS